MIRLGCRYCGYFLAETDASSGRIRLRCRGCGRWQWVDLRCPTAPKSESQPTHLHQVAA